MRLIITASMLLLAFAGAEAETLTKNRFAGHRTLHETHSSKSEKEIIVEVGEEEEVKLPSDFPSLMPSDTPSSVPSDLPSAVPSDLPSAVPSDLPSAVPSDVPSAVPSDIPSAVPSDVPSTVPSDAPSTVPSGGEGNRGIPDSDGDGLGELGDENPSEIDRELPSDIPSMVPSDFPSMVPSDAPSAVPSDAPSTVPSDVPSTIPSDVPSAVPSGGEGNRGVPDSDGDGLGELGDENPSEIGRELPSDFPSMVPSDFPSMVPSDAPSAVPSDAPSTVPSDVPSTIPSDVPSAVPSAAPSKATSDYPSSVPSGTPTGTPTGEGGFYVCDSSVYVDMNTVQDLTINYNYKLIPESNQNGVLSLIEAIEDQLHEFIMDSMCHQRRHRSLATAAGISKLPGDIPSGGCGGGCQSIAGKMTLRMTPDGVTGYGDLYCFALEEIYNEIESGALADKVEGIKKIEYIPDPHGTDRVCNIGVGTKPQPVSIFKPPSDSDMTRSRAEESPSPVLSSGMTIFVSFAGALSVLALTVLYARRRGRADNDVSLSNESASEDAGENHDEEQTTDGMYGEFTRVKITPSDPFADICSTYRTDDSFFEVPLSPDRMVHVVASGPSVEMSSNMKCDM